MLFCAVLPWKTRSLPLTSLENPAQEMGEGCDNIELSTAVLTGPAGKFKHIEFCSLYQMGEQKINSSSRLFQPTDVEAVLRKTSTIQGDHSGFDKPPVDPKTNVAFKYKLLLLKQNFSLDVNGRFGTT